ncbi:MAG: sialidase family protein [Pirellulaceae bacterium]|nr:sialidase family protein [Pirellulaceae bacterium]
MGKTWKVRPMNADLGENRYIYGYNADMIQLKDGTVLLTGDFRISQDSMHDDVTGELLPIRFRGTQPSVVRSTDGGLNWGERSPIVLYGGEAHLFELPSGKLLAASRYQRDHRRPGDPAKPFEHKIMNGFRPQFRSEESKNPHSEATNRVKNIYLSESFDGGRTWVNERRVTSFLQCPGDLVLLPDGTLVLTFLHRYPDDVAHTGIRAIVSDDEGATWRDGTYIISQGYGEDIDSGSSYPTSISMPDGTIITVCGNFTGGRLRLEAVHWQVEK